MFEEWIYIVSTIIIMFGFIVRIIQLLLKIKKNVNYYDYKNIFVVGNQKRIEEYYGRMTEMEWSLPERHLES